ncbi:MAG: helix-turn-helix transcriptional regulator [Candidatus Theseobacter exili]|nr:helix-turn-helix transcriptional regulator [Candidatus Theseobacter exili]
MEAEKDKLLIAIGDRVRLLRLERNLTQAQLASDIDKDQQNIHRLESGNYNPSIKFLNEVCSGLDITIQDFFCNLNNQE